MADDKIIIRSKLPSQARLPGTLALPDGKQRIRLGSGVITSLISSGGMALVYEIWNPELEVKRAVKLLHPDHSRESEERFYTEMKITAKLHHPNIVEIYGVGRWNDLPFIEMERIDGVTLEKILEDHGSLASSMCTAIGILVGRALNYAHNQTYVLYGKEYHGIIHRDLKPANIMITRDGVVKLMDFGIARPINASIHTCEGTVVGTMQYLAPEQLDGSMTDARTDIYSMGTVLYETITGVRAFPELNITKLVPDKLANTFVPLEQFSVKTVPTLCNLVHKCMRFEKEKRVDNMVDLLRLLGSIHKSLTTETPEQTVEAFMRQTNHTKTVARRRKRFPIVPIVVWALTGLSMAAILGASAWYAISSHRTRQMLVEEQASQNQSVVSALSVPEPVAPQVVASEQTPPSAEPTSQTNATETAATTEQNFDAFEAPAPTTAAAQTSTRPLSSRLRANASERSLGEGESSPAPQPSQTGVASTLSAEPPAPKEAPLVEQLAAQYGTNDIMILFTSEVERGHYAEAAKLAAKLPPSVSESKKAVLYRLRAAKGAGETSTVRGILLTSNVADGEFHLEKARYLFSTGRLAEARSTLEKAASTASEFMDPVMFRQQTVYEKALCISALFDRAPADGTRRDAMGAWYELKSLMRTSPEHPFFVKADEEIRRINKDGGAQ